MFRFLVVFPLSVVVHIVDTLLIDTRIRDGLSSIVDFVLSYCFIRDALRQSPSTTTASLRRTFIRSLSSSQLSSSHCRYTSAATVSPFTPHEAHISLCVQHAEYFPTLSTRHRAVLYV